MGKHQLYGNTKWKSQHKPNTYVTSIYPTSPQHLVSSQYMNPSPYLIYKYVLLHTNSGHIKIK